MLKRILFSTSIAFVIGISCSAQSLDNTKIASIIQSVGDSINGTIGAWQFHYHDRLMILLTDESHDRMRVISPVKMASEVSDQELRETMLANFHSALDVKYALSDDVMWTAYIHPLSSLTETQLRDALLQVYRACETYGTTYSSTELVFPGNSHDQKPSEPAPAKKM